ncbi:hypothetical protein ACVMGC_000965 [Bradyrhizobium barranii subsp. barranii]|uniref:hypothetical protein n=1 Tax=Bradyrhizobium TaxID=374 RepID=UPI001BA4E6B4|nr:MULTISPECIES: hypothetical protein [Bradyrhizobium]MBR0883891.1 hypothetical protein [Bradyrhizobium liaoningense]MCP1778883.1 hypothetical protein [Bradyrhizobium japonicum]MCP1958120.1 hypothetical protein [Bradyrhizobium japonicum]
MNDDRITRVDAVLARQLSESMAKNAKLHQRLMIARQLLEMIHDANRLEQRLPDEMLAAIAHAIKLADEVLK